MARFQLPYQNTIKWQDVNLNYQVLGQGKPVVLLHGALTNWTGIEFAQNLAKNYKVYIPDLPGYGASDKVSKQKHNLDFMVQAFSFFLTKLGLRKSPIITLSLGAVITLKTASLRLASGILILAGLPGKVESKNWFTKIMPVKIQKILIANSLGRRFLLLPLAQKNTGHSQIESKEFILKALSHTDPTAILDIDYEKVVNQEMPFSLAKLTNKTFFIYGENDPLQQSTKHLIKNYLTIPNAGHNIFTTNPLGSFELILKLLKD